MGSDIAYRIGLDVGANSIGWCVLALDKSGQPTNVIDLGTRILTASAEAGRDPQTGTSLSVDRRVARGMRRRRDRYLLRRSDLMSALVKHGLMPTDEAARKALEEVDPYEVRARALDEKVPIHHFGRALFHMHQRRGFKSNRKSDRANAEAGLIRQGIESLKEKMLSESARTVGEFLARRHAERRTVRARMVGTGKDAHFPIYLERILIEEEFSALWSAQSSEHPELSNAIREDLHAIMFRQRPLRPVKPGKCSLYPDTDHRAARALPVAQRFRILKELANLRLRHPGNAERPITIAERNILAEKLLGAAKLSFDQMRRALKLDSDVLFNLESERRKDLKGDETAAKLGAKKVMHKEWRDLDLANQTEIIEALLDEEDESRLTERLHAQVGDRPDVIESLTGALLPEGHMRFGIRALNELVAIMNEAVREFADPETGEIIERPIREDEAIAEMGLHHSDRRPDAQMDRLPYYGRVLTDSVVGTGDPAAPTEARYGRLPNPTVHIALNQLRQLVNSIIARYGPPTEIALEMARELKQSREEKAETEKRQTANQKANEKRRERLAELKQPDTGLNRLLLRLYDELPADDKLCVYSGRPIAVAQLFSSAVEIDHILPFSKTLDDGIGNKVLCFRDTNRSKRNRTPAEAFQGDTLVAMQERAARLLPAPKATRFASDAMSRFEDDGFQLPRRLIDTQYIARLAREYMTHVCPPNKVWATNGRLTAMLRGKWGLNSLLPDHNFAEVGHPKNRRDHRHHAIDAFVIAVTDRSLVQRLAHAAGRAELDQMERILADMPAPFPEFRAILDTRLKNTVVSHRPDRGVQGKLHEATAYGPASEAEKADGWTVVYRKPADALNKNEISRIRDPLLRTTCMRLEQDKGEEAVKTYLAAEGIRRVRLLKREDPSGLIQIGHGKDGRHMKAYAAGDNHHVDIVETPDGKWHGEGTSVFHANQPDHEPVWLKNLPGASLKIRLHKGDLIQVEHNGVRTIMRVYWLEPSNNRIRLAGNTEAGSLDKRHKDPDDPFRWFMAGYSTLKKSNARPVRVDVLGQVHSIEPRP
tara:strand:+ start:4797 stop:7952 length:3156 start_codon:yes stop_codon:yes gene_type:complete